MASIVYSEDDIARKCTVMFNKIRKLQRHFSTLETCPKPVIGAIHSACIGGGVDLICGTDIRLCTEDAWFQVHLDVFFPFVMSKNSKSCQKWNSMVLKN